MSLLRIKSNASYIWNDFMMIVFRFKYKDEYEKFKLVLSVIGFVLSVLNLFTNIRWDTTIYLIYCDQYYIYTQYYILHTKYIIIYYNKYYTIINTFLYINY